MAFVIKLRKLLLKEIFWCTAFAFVCDPIFAEEHEAAQKEQHESEKKPKSGGDAHGGEHGGAPETPSPFLTVGPFTVCIIKNYEVKGYIRLSVNLFCGSPKKSEALKHKAPKLQNNYIIGLSEALEQRWITGETPNVRHLKPTIQAITDKTLGKKKAEAVFIDSYFFAKSKPNPEDQK